MSIQGNFNNGMFQIATVASLAKINKTLEGLGISSIDELNSKIKTLEIEIAKAEDYGKEPVKMKELLAQYLEIKEAYEKAKTKKKIKKEKKSPSGVGYIILGTTLILTLIGIVTAVICLSW